MNEIKAKAQAVVDKYEDQLAQRGLKILISKRYFEMSVFERSGSAGIIARTQDRKKEEENGYNNKRNRYHCIVMSVIPSSNILPREQCRDYAIVIQKIERAHIGQEPRRIDYEEDKIISKIGKRILKILKKAEKSSPREICKNNIFDAIRYSSLIRYKYKSFFLGKEKFEWDFIFAITSIICVCILVCCIWFVTWVTNKSL